MAIKYLAGSALLLALAALSSWRAIYLHREFARHAERITVLQADQIKSSEKRWRLLAHILWLLSLSPSPLLLTSGIVEVSALIQRATGVAVTAGLALAALKLLGRVEFTKLFARDIALWNEVALVVLGFLASLAIATAWAVGVTPEVPT